MQITSDHISFLVVKIVVKPGIVQPPVIALLLYHTSVIHDNKNRSMELIRAAVLEYKENGAADPVLTKNQSPDALDFPLLGGLLCSLFKIFSDRVFIRVREQRPKAIE